MLPEENLSFTPPLGNKGRSSYIFDNLEPVGFLALASLWCWFLRIVQVTTYRCRWGKQPWALLHILLYRCVDWQGVKGVRAHSLWNDKPARRAGFFQSVLLHTGEGIKMEKLFLSRFSQTFTWDCKVTSLWQLTQFFIIQDS